MFIYSINHSDMAAPGSNNTERYRNPEFDALAEAQRSEMDVAKRQAIVWEAQRILAEDVPRITTYSRANVQTYNHERFTNLKNMSGEGLFNEWSPMVMEPLTNRRVPIVASNVNITNLNPFAARSVYDWRNLRLIYDKLVRLSVDVAPTAWAATSWDIVNDTTIDVTLRSGMKFHDGKPVTTADVKWTYEAFMAIPDSYFASFVRPIESIELIGNNVVRFNMKYAYAPFITTTLTQIPILPKHIWENVGDVTQYHNATPIGSGPFQFVRFRTGEVLVTTAYKDYFSPAKIDGYIFKIYASPEGVLTDLELKVVDMVSYDLIPAHINQIKANDGGKYSHLKITEAPDIGFFYIGLNNDRAPFNNKDFRIALTYLVDYDYALDVLLDGYGSRGGGGLVINAANEFWHNPEVPIYNTYNPAKAREILANAGFTWDSQGRLRMPK
jgi:peptide/nickel transport system substrate-binding protein